MNNIIIKKCASCGGEFATKHKTKAYCNSCYNKRNYHNGYYLYIVTDDNNKVFYVGCTEGLHMRMSSHLNGYTKIKDLIKSDRWSYIKYLDISNTVCNREELLMLENALIELYSPEYNEKISIIRNVDKLREFELLAEVHSLTQKWITYCENKQKKMLL